MLTGIRNVTSFYVHSGEEVKEQKLFGEFMPEKKGFTWTFKNLIPTDIITLQYCIRTRREVYR
ncbi:MAG: hypothetical protein RL115_859 [Bacteroidota bacterium]|jgi:hypothetical protein